MEDKIQVVVIGTIIKETVQYPDSQFGPVIGSPAAYSSVVMAAQGMRVGIVTYYGGDMPEIISELDVLDHGGMLPYAYTTTNRLVYREDGTKYVQYLKSAPDIRFDDIPDEYLKADLFSVCPMNYEVELDMVERLCKLGKTIFVDLGGYGGATSDVRHSVETDYGKSVVGLLCKNAAIIKASQEDLASIVPGKTVEEAAQYLVDAGAGVVVVTMGADGAMYRIGNGKPVYKKAFVPKSEMRDGALNFTGAGDSFGAGFLVSYIEDRDIEKAVVNGNATASLVVQCAGGCTYGRMPSRERVNLRLLTGE